jgi:hypothetical protein
MDLNFSAQEIILFLSWFLGSIAALIITHWSLSTILFHQQENGDVIWMPRAWYKVLMIWFGLISILLILINFKVRDNEVYLKITHKKFIPTN